MIIPLRVTATDLDQWANRIDARHELPRLIRRLVLATVPDVSSVRFPCGEGIQLRGFDGVVETKAGNAFVPKGLSVWELTTQKDVRGKAEEEYRKRLGDPYGSESGPGRTVFVFVTARRWPGKEQWANEKRREKRWSDIRVLDADDLEAWIELAPAIQVWLAERMGRSAEGFSSLEEFWHEWANATEPPLTVDLHLAGRRDAYSSVLSWLDGPSAALGVESESLDEALAFLAACIYAMPAPKREEILARAIIVSDKGSWRQLASFDYPLILMPKFLEPSIARALQKGHHVCIPLTSGNRYGEGQGSQRVCLPPLGAEEARQALIRMGLSEERARVICRDARRRPTVIRRLLARFPAIQTPEWAHSQNGRSLIPILLAGAWSDEREGDQDAVSRLAARPYAEIQVTLGTWRSAPDPPLRQLGSVWELISRVDSWRLLAPLLCRDDLDRFEEVALSVLGTLNPRYELSPENRLNAAIYGKTLPHSQYLREGLAETLVLLGAMGTGINGGNLYPVERAQRIVRKLLRKDVGWQLWASLSDILPLLAEAAPEIFLDEIERALQERSEEFTELFAQEESLGGAPHVGLLWALEMLALVPEYLSRVARLLASLAHSDPGGHMKNRPFNSLREILLSWLPQTPAPLERRLAAIDYVIRYEPEIGWRLLLAVLPDTHSAVSLNIYRPRWREWASDWSPGPASSAEITRFLQEIGRRLLANVAVNPRRWTDIIEHFGSLSAEAQEQALDQLLSLNPSSWVPEHRHALWDCLRTTVARHRRFAEAHWALPHNTLSRLAVACQHFEPEDPMLRSAWLFGHHVLIEAAEGREQDWDQVKATLMRARIEAIEEVFRCHGTRGLVELTRLAEDPGTIGESLPMTSVADIVEYDFLGATLGVEPLRQAGIQYVWRQVHSKTKGRDWAHSFLVANRDSLSADQLADFCLGLPPDAATWDLVRQFGHDVENKYWDHASWLNIAMYAEPEAGIRELLSHNRPYSALNVCAYHVEKGVRLPAQLLVEVLERVAVTDPNEETPFPAIASLGYHLESIVKTLDFSDEVDEDKIATLEFAFLPLLGFERRRGSKVLHLKLAREPVFFAEIVSRIFPSEGEDRASADPVADLRQAQVARHCFDLLHSWHHVPGCSPDGAINDQELAEWVRNVRRECAARGRSRFGDLYIGHVLAHAPIGQDGIWPDVSVRNVIESLYSEDLAQGFTTETYNKRGSFFKDPREGGRQEREIAARYQAWADAMTDQWPRTAALLRQIALSYEYDAQREDQDAERREDKW